MRGRRRVVVVLGVTTCLLLVLAVAALARPSFERSQVPADEDVALRLRVPETDEQEHHTVRVDVTVPDGFTPTACEPPQGWDCVISRQVMRFRMGSSLTAVRTDLATYGLYVRTADTNGTYAFRTVQGYNDGHETIWTPAGGTAPTVTVTGGTDPAAPSPPPSPSPSPAPPPPSPSPAAAPASPSPSPTSSPSPTPDPSRSPSPAPADETGATEEPQETAATQEPSPEPAQSGAGPTQPAPGPRATTAPDPSTDDTQPASGDAPELTAGPGPTGPSSDGMPALARPALSFVLVAGGWTIVEARRRREE